MDTNDINEIEQLNQQIDLMLSSEDALNAALEGDNPLLHVAARLANDSPPILNANAQARIEGQVNAAEILSPNYLAWTGGLVTIALVVAVLLFGVLPNNPASDQPSSNADFGADAEATENSVGDTNSGEDASSQSSDINEATETVELTDTVETTETVELTEIIEITETESPDLITVPESSNSQSTGNNPSVQSIPLQSLYVNPGGPVNVRSGPDTTFSIIATLTPNTEVLGIARTAASDWTQVIIPDGRQGWIATFLLSDKKGSDGQTTSPGGGGRDTDDCERGNSCNSGGQSGDNKGNANGRGKGNG